MSNAIERLRDAMDRSGGDPLPSEQPAWGLWVLAMAILEIDARLVAIEDRLDAITRFK